MLFPRVGEAACSTLCWRWCSTRSRQRRTWRDHSRTSGPTTCPGTVCGLLCITARNIFNHPQSKQSLFLLIQISSTHLSPLQSAAAGTGGGGRRAGQEPRVAAERQAEKEPCRPEKSPAHSRSVREQHREWKCAAERIQFYPGRSQCKKSHSGLKSNFRSPKLYCSLIMKPVFRLFRQWTQWLCSEHNTIVAMAI